MMLSAKIAAVEFDEREVRLAVVKTGGRQPALLERHSEPVEYAEPGDRTDAFVRAVEALAGRLKTKPAAYVLCASSRQTVVRALTVPFKGRRVAAAVRFELEPYLAFPIDDLVVDHSFIREADGGTQVLAVGMRRATLEEQLAILNAAGIDPEGIALDGAGLVALWQARRRPAPGLNAVLHVRERGSALAVLCGKALAYLRHLPVTAAQMHENPAAAARDVQNSLRAFAVAWEGHEELATLTVTGVSLFEEERALFEENARMPVLYEDLGLKVKSGARSNGVAAEPAEGNRWEALAGAALAAAGDQPYAYNFRQGELAQPQALGALVRHAAFSLVLGAIALLGFLFYLYLDHNANKKELARLGGEMWTIFYQTFPDSARAKDGQPPADVGGQLSFSFMQEEMDKAGQGQGGLSIELFSRPTPLDLLAEIGRSIPADKVTLTRVEIQPQLGQRKDIGVVVEGIAQNPEVFNQVFASLSQSKLLRVDPNPTQQSKGSQLEFTINATLQGGQDAQT